MAKKDYIQSEEDSESIEMASEPVATTAQSTSRMTHGNRNEHDWIDDLDWDRFPSHGPFSEEEAIARIEQAEKDLNNPTKWISAEDAKAQLYEKYPWLR